MSLTKSNQEGTKSNNKIFNDNIDFFIKEDKNVAKKSNTQCKDSNIIFLIVINNTKVDMNNLKDSQEI